MSSDDSFITKQTREARRVRDRVPKGVQEGDERNYSDLLDEAMEPLAQEGERERLARRREWLSERLGEEEAEAIMEAEHAAQSEDEEGRWFKFKCDTCCTRFQTAAPPLFAPHMACRVQGCEGTAIQQRRHPRVSGIERAPAQPEEAPHYCAVHQVRHPDGPCMAGVQAALDELDAPTHAEPFEGEEPLRLNVIGRIRALVDDLEEQIDEESDWTCPDCDALKESPADFNASEEVKAHNIDSDSPYYRDPLSRLEVRSLERRAQRAVEKHGDRHPMSEAAGFLYRIAKTYLPSDSEAEYG